VRHLVDTWKERSGLHDCLLKCHQSTTQQIKFLLWEWLAFYTMKGFQRRYVAMNETSITAFTSKSPSYRYLQDRHNPSTSSTHISILSSSPSTSILLTLNTHQSTLSPKPTQIQLLLPKHPHALLAPTEISHTTPRHNLSYQSTLRTPHMYAIPTS
jgi:hypothetical protein